jgi:hypothetical protein
LRRLQLTLRHPYFGQSCCILAAAIASSSSIACVVVSMLLQLLRLLHALLQLHEAIGTPTGPHLHQWRGCEKSY